MWGKVCRWGVKRPGSRLANLLCDLGQSRDLSGSLSTSERSGPDEL